MIAVVLWCTGDLSAQDTQISGVPLEWFQPAVDGHGYLGVNSPRSPKGGEFHLKLHQSVAYRHLLEVGVGGAQSDLVNRIFTSELNATLGVNNSISLGAHIPFHWGLREADFNTLQPFTTHSFGDVRLSAKLRLLQERNILPGLGLLFVNTFPTGNERKFVGTPQMMPSVALLIEKDLPYVRVGVNLGARFPAKKEVLGITFDDQFTYAAAMQVPFGFLDPQLFLLGEIFGHVELRKAQIVTAPVSFLVGIRKKFNNGLALTAGGGGAWNNAIGNARVRGLVSVSYLIDFHQGRKLRRRDQFLPILDAGEFFADAGH